MRPIPLRVVEWFFRLGVLRRPRFLAAFVPERPDADEVAASLLMLEKPDGHLKWAHLQCPKCGPHSASACRARTVVCEAGCPASPNVGAVSLGEAIVWRALLRSKGQSRVVRAIGR